jgi:hypothetical protein
LSTPAIDDCREGGREDLMAWAADSWWFTSRLRFPQLTLIRLLEEWLPPVVVGAAPAVEGLGGDGGRLGV